jgi:hypothetical protein
MLSTQQAEDKQMRENQNVGNARQGEAKHRNYERLKRGDGQTETVHCLSCWVQQKLNKIRHVL